MNKEYELIYKIAHKLDKHKIPSQYKLIPFGFQLIVEIKNGTYRVDAFAFNSKNEQLYGTVEIMGGLTREELDKDNVLRGLTPNQIAKRFIWCYKHHTPIYKDKLWRDK